MRIDSAHAERHTALDGAARGRGTPLRLMLVLNSPSPHQVDLLNALAEREDVSTRVGYVFQRNPGRTWGAPTPNLPWTMVPTRLSDIVTGRLKEWVASQPADVWIVTSIYTSPSTHCLTRTLNGLRARWAYLGEPPRPRSGMKGILRDALVRQVVRGADGVICTGTRARELYASYCRPHQKRASIPYFIDIDEFLRLPLPGTVRGSAIKFVTSAQLVHRKGLDVLLRACELLPKHGWELTIYGAGPKEASLVAQARRGQMPVRFAGSADYGDRAEVFRGHHCFVFSTRWDGWGMVVPEAMAAGLPVISTDRAMSAHDFVEDGVNGYIGPCEDPNFLAASMCRLIRQPHRLPAFSAAARAAVINYRPQLGGEQLVKFARELCAGDETRLYEPLESSSRAAA